MKIVLNQQVNRNGEIHGKIVNLYKVFESTSIVPHKGDFINDSLWKDPPQYEVSEVVIDYTYNWCIVELFAYQLPTDEAVDEIIKLAEKYHGWSTQYPLN